MAHKHNSIQSMVGDRVPVARRMKTGLIVTMVILAVVGLAWFDGGEEPLRPIVQDIPVPENGQ